MGQAAPAVHASAIAHPDRWIPGAIDPASSGSSQVDGRRLREVYTELGLTLYDADNSVEAGIHACYQRMVSGRLKVFTTLRNWLSEFRIYRRDDNGKVLKENDHCMDATRYLVMTGMRYARTAPDYDDPDDRQARWRTRNQATGY
jgi:hypothetical protein